MRISDWSSDVCSSDLVGEDRQIDVVALFIVEQVLEAASGHEDRGAQAADDILCRLGPPDARERQVPADILRDRAFATQHLESGGVLEPQMRTEARRDGTECVSTCGSRWWRGP